MTKIRHVLGISGGKDSAALAIYLKDKYPNLDIEYYTCDTGKELDETYTLIQNLEIYLGLKIKLITAAENSPEASFDHFLKMYGGFLPSANSRWCTKKLKLEPFEKYVGNDLVISYVGIRGDENRDGYISRKTNIQSIFPFRRNIWSEDVINKLLNSSNINNLSKYAQNIDLGDSEKKYLELLSLPVSLTLNIQNKFNKLLDTSIAKTNRLVFEYLKTTDYPLSKVDYFPLLENEDNLVRDDIFRILKESGVGVPSYYEKKSFTMKGKTGDYSRSRSGCYFCFFQQKIEWVWLYEQHPELYKKAMGYEKEGYTWNQEESLADIIKPTRIAQIKEEYLKRLERSTYKKSPYLLDIIDDSESIGCASCFT